MPPRSRLQIGLRRLQNRFVFPYSPRWLRRVGSSLAHTRRSSFPRFRLGEHPPVRTGFRQPHSLQAKTFKKRTKRGRLSRTFLLGILGERARMGAEGIQRPGLDDEDLLEGWKAIADHLNKRERTVQRWEKGKALPVRRLKAGSPDEQGRVFAYKKELDAWWKEVLSTPDAGADLASDPEIAPPQPADLSPVEKQLTRYRNERLIRRRWFVWIALAIATVLIVLGLRFIQSLRSGSSRARVTLAVRPFKNLGSDSSWEFVAAGLTEEMVTRLGQRHPQQMGVVRLTPGYADAPPERLAKDINADYVFEGSIRKIGDRAAITAQLIQVTNQSVVWAQSYE